MCCAYRAPGLTPELTLSSVQLSLCLFCSVVATFSLLHFPLLNLHIGVQSTAAALWEGGGVFDVKAKVVWRD